MNTDYTIVLAGNPNVGKSSIFNNITGLKQHTGNWTGKTVENCVGEYIYNKNKYKIVDLPGTYSLTSDSEEEEVARTLIQNTDYDNITIIVDGTSLERNLILVQQILNITKNVVVCINLIDEMKKKKIYIDKEKLEKELGVDIVFVQGNKKKTMKKLLSVIEKSVMKEENEIKQNKEMKKKNENQKNENFKNENIIKEAERIAKLVSSYDDEYIVKKDKKIDKILTSKTFGIPIMLLFLGLIFYLTITGANYPSQMLFKGFGILKEHIINWLEYVHCNSVVQDILMNGIYQTLTWVISVMLPPMAIFFPLFTFLEDLGYLPRIAFNTDRLFAKCKCSGKQMITMCMGFGCNAAGVMGCRIINSKREKLLAIITNSFVPCNGRFPLLIILASVLTYGVVNVVTGSILSTILVVLVILLGIFMTIFVSNVLNKMFFKGEESNFTLELPPYRKPQLIQILTRSLIDKVIKILIRAIVVAAPAGLVIWCFAHIQLGNISILDHIAMFLQPLGNIMGLDGYILTAFVLGIPANEIVLPILLMAYTRAGNLIDMEEISGIRGIFVQNGWNILTAINMMIVTLLHFPCTTTLLTIKKETGSLKWTAIAFIAPTLCGIVVCIVTNLIYTVLV